jgi:DmsE family decaheme c-type cytochrome
VQTKRFVSIGVGLLLAVFVTLAFEFLVSSEPAIAQVQNIQVQQQAPVQQSNTCLNCHNNPTVTSVFETAHGSATLPGSPSSNPVCANCHGASTDHAGSMRTPEVVFGQGSDRFPASDVEVQNQSCLNCHQSRETVHWAASSHQAADLSCASCHTVHGGANTALNERTDASLCLSCHLEQRSQLNRRSHHPVAEGLMTCNDCHNPHGSDTVALLARSTVNETCTGCHAEKRGPFLWEHQPVNEDCTTCHNPHGATQASMLKVRQPFLCQSCHSEAFHPSTLYSGTGIAPAGAQQNLLGSSCTNCHSSVHGSNHPSGSRLTR